MKRTIPIRYFIIFDVILTIIMTGYWTLTDTASNTLAIAAAIFIAALPLPYFLADLFPRYRGIRKAKSAGISLNDKTTLADVSNLDTVIINKAGIITAGKPKIVGLIPEGVSQLVLLTIAGSAEKNAKHPIGKAILKMAEERVYKLHSVAAANEIPSCGVEAIVSHTTIRVGRAQWLQAEGVHISAEILTKTDQIAQRGQIPVLVANGNFCRGIIVLEDAIIAESTFALHKLNRQQIKTVMLTGESRRLANAIGKAAGIDIIKADLTTDAIAREVQLLQAHGAMIAAISQKETSPLALATDLMVYLTTPAAEIKPPKDTIYIPSGQLWDFTILIDISRHYANSAKQNRHIAIIALIMMLAPALGLFHVCGGPFLPPLAALTGQITAIILIVINSWRH